MTARRSADSHGSTAVEADRSNATAEPKVANDEVGSKPADKPQTSLVHVEDSTEEALRDEHGYIWKIDDGGHLLLRSAKGDPADPRAWPKWKRYGVVGLASLLNNLVCICVSGYSTGTEQMEAEFGFSTEIGTLGLSLYILGFAIGPMLLAPLSEYWGRRKVYLASWFVFTMFQLPLALARNVETILVCRFFQGFAGSTPLANTGGVVHDVFGIDEGGYAVAIYALSSVDGPPLGNVLSGFLAQEQGWRWLYWTYFIIYAVFLVVIFFGMPETRSTILLSQKSKILRERTGKPIYAEHELAKQSPGYFYKVTIIRPFKFLFTEPITYLCAGINGFAYGMIFLSNEAFPLVFGSGNNGHNWSSAGLINLTFGAYVVGSLIAFCLQPLQERMYRKACRREGMSDPEARWWSALWGTPFMPAGLMVAAWTSYPSLPWIAPLIGFGMFGFGFYCIIAAILNYVVDGYGHYSASALGGVVFVRNIVGAIFPLFAQQMFVRLGNQWSLFLLSMLSMFLVPIPFYLYYRGKQVRAASPYCATHFGKDESR